MRTYLMCAFLLLAGAIGSAQTATVSGTVNDPSTTNAGTVKLQFVLGGCAGNQPRYNGSALITGETDGANIAKTFTATAGVISGTIYKNDSITCGSSTTSNYWAMRVIRNGVAGPACNVRITASPFDATQPSCLNQNPAISVPVDSALYAKLDATNQPFTAAVTVPKLDTIVFVDGTTYSTLAAAYAALPATGGTIMVPTGYAETMSASLTIAKPYTRIEFMGDATITMGSSQVIVSAGTNGVAIIGHGGFGSAGSGSGTGGVNFNYTGTSEAFLIGSSSAGTFFFRMEDVHVRIVSAGTSATAISLKRCINYRLTRPRINALSTSSSQVGILLDGTGDYTGGTIDQPYISNGNLGIHGLANANANTILGGLVTGITTNNAVGILWTSGNGNFVYGTDIENWFIGASLLTSATNNTVDVRTENNTTALSIASGASGNIMRTSKVGATVSDGSTAGTNRMVIGSTNTSLKIGTTGKVILAVYENSASLNYDFSGAGITEQDLTITVTGAAAGDEVVLGLPTALQASGIQCTGFVSAADTVTVRCMDVTSSGANPAAATVKAQVNHF